MQHANDYQVSKAVVSERVVVFAVGVLAVVATYVRYSHFPQSVPKISKIIIYFSC